MYKLQPTPDEEAVLDNGVMVYPLATLRDEYGGISHIVEDDHCYVLLNGPSKSGSFTAVKHWYTEAVDAIKTLPSPKP